MAGMAKAAHCPRLAPLHLRPLVHLARSAVPLGIVQTITTTAPLGTVHARVVDPGATGMRAVTAPQSLWKRLIRGLLRMIKLAFTATPIVIGGSLMYLFPSLQDGSFKERVWRYARGKIPCRRGAFPHCGGGP
jgi:hypothetical protein